MAAAALCNQSWGWLDRRSKHRGCKNRKH